MGVWWHRGECVHNVPWIIFNILYLFPKWKLSVKCIIAQVILNTYLRLNSLTHSCHFAFAYIISRKSAFCQIGHNVQTPQFLSIRLGTVWSAFSVICLQSFPIFSMRLLGAYFIKTQNNACCTHYLVVIFASSCTPLVHADLDVYILVWEHWVQLVKLSLCPSLSLAALGVANYITRDVWLLKKCKMKYMPLAQVYVDLSHEYVVGMLFYCPCTVFLVHNHVVIYIRYLLYLMMFIFKTLFFTAIYVEQFHNFQQKTCKTFATQWSLLH